MPLSSSSSSSHDGDSKPSVSASDILKASQNKEVDSQCRSCVNLLQQVLLSADSKPTQILASLLAEASTAQSTSTSSTSIYEPVSPSLRWRKATNGVDVQIPVAQAAALPSDPVALPTVPRRLSRLHPPELDDYTTTLPATVSSNTSTTTILRRPSLLPSPKQQLATSVVPAVPHEASQQSAALLASRRPLEWLSIRCQPCKLTGPEGGARAFVMGPTPLSIVVCTNRLKHQNYNDTATQESQASSAVAEMEEILTHELVHVYDVRQLQLDLRDCESLAYSEVRAAREAECRHHVDLSDKIDNTTAAAVPPPRPPPAWYTLGRNASSLTTRRTCASRTAQLATANLFAQSQQAQHCVQSVFERAFRDKRPFAAAARVDANSTSREQQQQPSST